MEPRQIQRLTAPDFTPAYCMATGEVPKLALSASGVTHRLALPEPLLPAQQACVVELILMADVEAGRAHPLTVRRAVCLTFHFDDAQDAPAPVLCFNCQYKVEPLALRILS